MYIKPPTNETGNKIVEIYSWEIKNIGSGIFFTILN